jgi:hypothetical protein
MPHTSETVDFIAPASCIASLDDGPLRGYPSMQVEQSVDPEIGYRELALAVIQTALNDLVIMAQGRKVHTKSAYAATKPRRLSPEEAARAVALAEALEHEPVFQFWCEVIGHDSEILIDGALRRILAGEALRFQDSESVTPATATEDAA